MRVAASAAKNSQNSRKSTDASSVDLIIIGAGIIGLTIAAEAKRQDPRLRTVILEKEPALGEHASGRNSGVVHAGIYYEPGSLRARFCVAGALRLLDFCREHRLPLAHTGKLIVATTASERELLVKLAANAAANGARTELIGSAQVLKIEPEVTAASCALHSPNTMSVEPKAVLQVLSSVLSAEGTSVRFGSQATHVDPEGNVVQTSDGTAFRFRVLVNAAGAHADRVATAFGVGAHFGLLPFRGSYFELRPGTGLDLRGHIYPVPHPATPVLGVHFTKACDGRVYVGPTALPALGREHYKGLAGLELRELGAMARVLAAQALDAENGASFRGHVARELRHLTRRGIANAARKLVPRLKAEHLVACDKRGIRPQLFDRATRRFVNDFVIEGTPSSVHVLNAISPGLTGSFAFAEHLVADWILPRLRSASGSG